MHFLYRRSECTCIIRLLCHLLQSEPIIWSHVSPLNQWEDSTWWKQLFKAPTPLFSVSCQETGIIPSFWKTWIFKKVSGNETILRGGGPWTKIWKEKSLQYFEILDLCGLSLLSSYHASRLRRSNKPNLSQDNDISQLKIIPF